MKSRSLHKLLGLTAFIFLINASVTGVLRANAKGLYWKDRPPQKDNAVLASPAFGLDQVFKYYQEHFPGNSIKKVQLKTFLGKTVYQLETSQPDQKYLLLDAQSGSLISPVSEQTASQVARLVAGDAELKLTESVEAYKARKSSEPRPAFHFVFKDDVGTEIYVDQATGETLQVLDKGRRFALWVNRLHELDFADQGRVWLTVIGFLFIFLSFTGLSLALSFKKAAVGR